MLKELILGIALLSLITLPVSAVYRQDNFLLEGNSEEGWILITPEEDYFAMWFGEELRAIWITRATGNSECLIIREGLENPCNITEFSFMMYNYPSERIKALKDSGV